MIIFDCPKSPVFKARCVAFVPTLLLLLIAPAFAFAQKPELVVQTGHTQGATAVAFSPDGRMLATSSWDCTIKLWDVATGRELRSLTGSDPISSIVFSSGGKTIVSASSWGKIELWDVVTGREIRTFNIPQSSGIVFGNNGNILAGTDLSGEVAIWYPENGAQLRSLQIGGMVGSIAFNPDATIIAAASAEIDRLTVQRSVIKMWNVSTGQELITIETKSLDHLAFSPTGETIASGNSEGTITLWDSATGRKIRSFGKNLYL